MKYVHKLSYRFNKFNVETNQSEITFGESLVSKTLDTNDPQDALINKAEIITKALRHNTNTDGVIYKINDEVVFFASKYFYLYPNYTD